MQFGELRRREVIVILGGRRLSDKMTRTNGKRVRNDMPLEVKSRPSSGAVSRAASIAVLAFVVAALFAAPAAAQTGEPIKIGYSMALTGGLAPNGKSALLAQKIWEEDTNAGGGLLGRPVRLIYNDDQTNPATVPGIYTKLLDVDQVDLVIGGYGTNMLVPAMPVVMQKKKMLIGLFGAAVNREFHYPNYFAMIPSGPDPESVLHQGLLRRRGAAEPEAEDGGDRRRRRGVRPACLRRRARKCQGGRPHRRL